MSRKQDIESPKDDYGMFHPEGAEKLPIKHWPHDSMKKREHVIEGPCDEGYYKD